jgi:hypothetical protein
MRWKWCTDSEDIRELEIKGGCGSSRLLGLVLGGGDMRLKGGEGSNQVS